MGRRKGTKRKASDPPPLCFFSNTGTGTNTRLRTRAASRQHAAEAENVNVSGSTNSSEGNQVSNLGSNAIPETNAIRNTRVSNRRAAAAAAAPIINQSSVEPQSSSSTAVQSAGPGSHQEAEVGSGVNRDLYQDGGAHSSARTGGSVGNLGRNVELEAAATAENNGNGEPNPVGLLFDNIPSSTRNLANSMFDTPQQCQLNSVNTGISNNSSNNSMSNTIRTNVDLVRTQSLQSGQNSLISVCSPLGEGVPNNIRDKIIRGDFVDFSLLIEKGREDNNTNSGVWDGKALSLNDEGFMVFKEVKSTPKVSSVHSWTSAFLIFSAIYLQAHPTRSQEILKYGHMIRTAASRFGSWGWRDYDIQFRMRMQAHPERSWATIDAELWALYVAVPAQPRISQFPVSNQFRNQRPSQHQSSASSFYSSHRGGPASGLSQRGGFAQGLNPNKPCYDYNRGTGCKRSFCKYRHFCMFCRFEGHGATTCKKTANRGRAPPK